MFLWGFAMEGVRIIAEIANFRTKQNQYHYSFRTESYTE